MNREQSSSITVILVHELIQDLVNTGMSYARISTRLGLSPSTIQKIVTKDRMPRIRTLVDLSNYYVKIFESPQIYGAVTANYYPLNAERINLRLVKIKHLLSVLSTVQ